MNNIMMRCGHVAMGRKLEDNTPYCLICNCSEVAEIINVEGRKAKCSECGYEVDSSVDLPFFKYRPDHNTDQYYCGCWGWD